MNMLSPQFSGQSRIKTSQRRLPSSINQAQQYLESFLNQNQNLEVKMEMSHILGTNQSDTKSANIYAYKKNELIYYLKNMFVKYNTCTKNYRIFYEESLREDDGINGPSENADKGLEFYAKSRIDAVKEDNLETKNEYFSRNELLMTKYFPCGQNSLLLVLKKIEGFFYLSLFWTQWQIPAVIIKISQDKKQVYTNCTFHEKKGYIYLLYKVLKKENNSQIFQKQQHLKIIEIITPSSVQSQSISKIGSIKLGSLSKMSNRKVKTLINCAIKKTGGGFHDLQDLIVGADHTELYMYGLDYFRQWKILYSEKIIKESNYRNVERNIKKEKIIQVFWVNENLLDRRDDAWRGNEEKKTSDCTKSFNNFLLIITAIEVLFVQNNELIQISQIPDQSPFQKTHREAAQLVLQKSLNQIYKTKFRVEAITEENENDQLAIQRVNGSQNRLTSASRPWIEKVFQNSQSEEKIRQNEERKELPQKIVRFCASFDCSRIYIYRIQNDFTVKIESSINSYSEHNEGIIPKENQLKTTIKNISVSPEGTLILLTDSLKQNYLNNRSEDFENSDIDPIYTAGHGHISSIKSISSPEVVNHIVTISEDGSLKIWNKGQKERHLIIDTKLKTKPIEALMHPCGFLTIVNFGLEIKIFGIVSNQFQEIFAVKTNDYCSSMQFSKIFNFLITNEKNMIKIYDPFTLHAFCKIQPDDLRLEYKKIQLSQNGEYIVYQCCNNKVYKLSTSAMFSSESNQNTKDFQFRNESKFEREQIRPDKPALCHRQSQQYTCFYFNFGTAKQNSALALEGGKSEALSSTNIFIGFTKSKYMVIYSNFGENLIAEFPVVNGVSVTNCCITDEIMFLGTNKGVIIGYQWPILQSHLQVQISKQKTANGSLIGRLKPPKCIFEFKVWRDGSPITNLHKISNKSELVVGGVDGILGFVEYSILKNGSAVFQNGASMFSSQRKRMIEATNNTKLVKVAQIQKITKLIQKTENDIEKIEYEIQNEKDRKNKQSQREKMELKANAEKKNKSYLQEREQKFIQHQKQLNRHRLQYEAKKKQLEKLMATLQNNCRQKSDYEKDRIKIIKNEIENEKKNHKLRIMELIDTHKSNIRKLKNENLSFVRSLQQQFEMLIRQKYSQDEIISQIKEVDDEELNENEDIRIQKLKVLQLEDIIMRKTEEFLKISTKAEISKKQDETMQKKFEKNLEKYNEYRYENLVLHSELLKIQNQLHQRKQILSKKDQIINMAYQEKQINETFKQFVSGAICGLEDQKGKAYNEYVKKEQDLQMLFEQLSLEINKSEAKKLKLEQQNQAVKIYEREMTEKGQNIKLSIEQLKNLKKYLLVQGVSEDSEQKRFYQEQEKLLSTIRWLEKRFKMNCMNEKKMTILKRSGVSQVINQNKNLLEECNQLREEGIVYENQIEHLSKKLAEANQIIELERKVSSQSYTLNQQSEKLNEIRKMFQHQIEAATQELQEESQKL